MNIDEYATNATSLFLYWATPKTRNIELEYLPSISKAENGAKWTNASTWIKETGYQFSNLQPYTRYNMTVFVRQKSQSNVTPPAKYNVATTAESTPSAPMNVVAVQKNGTVVEVSWRPPLYPNGLITGYELYVSPPLPPRQYPTSKTSALVGIVPGFGEYSFWVIAKNRRASSITSTIATLVFDGAAIIEEVKDLKVSETTNNSVTLTWKKVNGAEGYNVTPRAPLPYPMLHTKTATTNSITITPLAPGTNYTFEVNAFKKNYVGKSIFIMGGTTGNPLPAVTKLDAVVVKMHGTTVKLSWDPVKSPLKIKWQYAIHYALDMKSLFLGMATILEKF